MNLRRTYLKFLLLLPVATIFVSGCKRSEAAFDGRTLEKRPHVETVAPEDRKDAFRP
jgi:hypothetical protein